MKILLALLLTLLGTAPGLARTTIGEMLDLSELARFRDLREVGMFSSYDRTGLNDDGFSGKHSFLRKEGDGLVIAELKGPGVLTRIWTPTPLDAPIEFYIDGDKKPRMALPFIDLFTGKRAPFTGELVGRGLGGYYSYVPVEFARSVKVVMRAPKLQFYQINYALYAPGTKVESFTPEVSYRLRAPNEGQRVETAANLAPGSTITLFESVTPGRIQSLKIGPAEAFAGPERDIDIRITWDGATKPAVEMPISDFFGYSFGDPATRSLLLGTEDGWNYLRAPMPFSRGAKVELVSRRANGKPIPVQAEFVVSDRGRQPDEGMLHGRWHRETETRRGNPFEILDVSGRGHVVAFTVQAQGAQPGDTGFFEGDEQVTIDGKLAIHGTGTEDMFNGGWYGLPGRWNERGLLPFNGALDYSRQLARTGGYRILISDAYSFGKSLRFTLEHGPEHNAADGDYLGTALFYLDQAEDTSSPPSEAERRVIPAKGFRIGTFPLMGVDTIIDASLNPGGHETERGWVSYVTMERDTNGTPEGLSAQNEPVFNDTWGPPLLSLRVEVPQKGKYDILVDALTGPAAAKLQLLFNNDPVAPAVDFYSPTPKRGDFVSLGQIDLEEGPQLIHIVMPGRNRASTAARVDIVAVDGRLIAAAD